MVTKETGHSLRVCSTSTGALFSVCLFVLSFDEWMNIGPFCASLKPRDTTNLTAAPGKMMIIIQALIRDAELAFRE